MSKNTGSNKFRKVDVDQFDPDKFVEDSVPEETGGQGPSESEVNAFLAQYPFLKFLLQNISLKK